MSDAENLRVVGRAEPVNFPECDLWDIPARIDTGAQTSALWASDVRIEGGKLSCLFFDTPSPHYTGKRVTFDEFDDLMVASSNGIAEKRFKVKLLVGLRGKKVRASFTLANRETQVYPVLIGRNVLLGKFVVDVKRGKPLRDAERRRSAELQMRPNESEEQV
ncbi:MAG TPA: RimK/LysX family protein [Patescibacteria group bacterium]|nr:RimK/LysX family protein [Patescibacteria group bacterium]